MATTYKAIAAMRELVDSIKLQVAATLPVVVESNDANGHPVVTLSADATPIAGEKVIVIRMKPIGAIGAQNIIGQTAEQFSHHVIQVCTEKNFEGATDNVNDILSPAELLPVLIECGRRGSFVEWYRTANTTVPSTSAMVEANLASTWRNLYWNVLAAG
jgi:hypothetical protein